MNDIYHTHMKKSITPEDSLMLFDSVQHILGVCCLQRDQPYHKYSADVESKARTGERIR